MTENQTNQPTNQPDESDRPDAIEKEFQQDETPLDVAPSGVAHTPPIGIHGETVGEGRCDIYGTLLPSNLPVNYRERFQIIIDRPDSVDVLMAHMANGGTLITLAEAWGVRYSDISNWVGLTQERRDRYNTALCARNEWEIERLLQELRAIATVDIREAYKSDGTLKDIRDIPYNVAAAISGIESDEIAVDGDVVGKTRKVKFWDKAKAIEMFMKKHGMLVERHHVNVTTRLEDLVGAANVDAVDAVIVSDATADTQGAEALENSAKVSEGVPGGGGLERDVNSDPSPNFPQNSQQLENGTTTSGSNGKFIVETSDEPI